MWARLRRLTRGHVSVLRQNLHQSGAALARRGRTNCTAMKIGGGTCGSIGRSSVAPELRSIIFKGERLSGIEDLERATGTYPANGDRLRTYGERAVPGYYEFGDSDRLRRVAMWLDRRGAFGCFTAVEGVGMGPSCWDW